MSESAFPTIGQPAPPFAVDCVDGVQPTAWRVALEEYAGRWLILIFYPRDFSFVCPTELTAFSAYMADFAQRDCELLGVSVDSVESHQQWLTKPQSEAGLGPLQFPLASDPGGSMSRSYGVWVPDKQVATRGLFIIDAASTLQYAVVHNLNVGRTPDEVLRVLDGLRDGGLCPSNWTAADGTIDPEDALQPGRVLGHYRIQQLLGSGTFGTVFAAFDLRLERMVALKVLKRNVIDSRELLLAEARTAARLNHANVCTIYAVEEEDGLPVIAMEFIDGQPLGQRIQRGMEMDEVLSCGHQIALGLADAHRHNVVHGDFKPANIIVSDAGHAKILDFGLARSQRKPQTHTIAVDTTQAVPPGPLPSALAATVEFGQSAGSQSLSKSGTIRGTPLYMSPEQSQGRRTIPASDVFSFGLTFYEMATGRRGLAVNSYDELVARVNDEALAEQLSAAVDEPLRQVLADTLTRDEKRRPPMFRVADYLGQIIGN